MYLKTTKTFSKKFEETLIEDHFIQIYVNLNLFVFYWHDFSIDVDGSER